MAHQSRTNKTSYYIIWKCIPPDLDKRFLDLDIPSISDGSKMIWMLITDTAKLRSIVVALFVFYWKTFILTNLIAVEMKRNRWLVYKKKKNIHQCENVHTVSTLLHTHLNRKRWLQWPPFMLPRMCSIQIEPNFQNIVKPPLKYVYHACISEQSFTSSKMLT